MQGKIVLVVDTHYSAMGISAHQHSANKNIKVLAALDYSSSGKFVEALVLQNSQTVIFTWRRILLDLLMVRSSRRQLLELRKKSRIYFVVADHLGIESKYFAEEMPIFNFADGYFVTNRMLEHEYSIKLPYNRPSGLFRDLPNLSNIDIVRKESIERLPNKVIWVGNSKWGSHYGFHDHKGLSAIALPLKEKLEKANPKFVLKIIDSATGYLDNLSVLREIASSKVLIQTSDSEGTGIPLLEALALGTIPITNRVGVAEEILTDSFSGNVIKKEVDYYFDKIMEVANTNSDENKLVGIFANYLESSGVPEVSGDTKKYTPLDKFSLQKQIMASIFWKIRFIKNFLRH